MTRGLPLALLAGPVAAGPPLPTTTPNPTLIACTGNCDGGELVSIDELVRGVNIALDQLGLEVCGRFDADGNGRVTVDELVQAVNNALHGCGVPPPTPAPSRTATGSPTFTATPTETPTAPATLTASATLIPTATRTASPVPTSANSVCGGPITTAPKLCSVEVLPNPVPLFGEYSIAFCVSDRDGDLLQHCRYIRTGLEEPNFTCVALGSTGQTVNGCFQVGPFASTNPAGNYTLLFRVDDRLGNRAGPIEAAFAVR